MESIFNNLAHDPLHYIGVLICGLAVYSFLIYLRGFISGTPNIIRNSGHVEHQYHARVRTIGGTVMLLVFFIIWEFVRSVGSWFGYGDGHGVTAFWIAGVALVVWAFVAVKALISSGTAH